MNTAPAGAPVKLGGAAYAAPDLKATLTPIAAIQPYPENPRRGDQPSITASILENGLYAGVVAQVSTGNILVGNHRFRALEELGATSVPVVWMDVDDTRAAQIVARDNLTSDKGTYDQTELLELLEALDADGALDGSGYSDADLDAITRAVADLRFTEDAANDPGTLLDANDGLVDTSRDTEAVTVTVDAGHKPALYSLLSDLDWVRNMEDAVNRKQG